MKALSVPLIIVTAICAVFGIYVAAVINGWWPFLGLDYQKNGQFGDSFGAFTSLFTALAFGGLLLTLWFQSKSLELAKADGQKQHFENILFRMLDIHNQIVRDIDLRKVSTGKVIDMGRDCFLRYYTEDFRVRYESTLNDSPTSAAQEIIDKAYTEFAEQSRHNLGHYFRYLYNIFKFIRNAPLTGSEKKVYSNIVRAQLSDYELVVLYYNCLTKSGRELFKPMCEEFALFNNLPKELLLDPAHEHLYAPSAFL
jgi:hypothetical protein